MLVELHTVGLQPIPLQLLQGCPDWWGQGLLWLLIVHWALVSTQACSRQLMLRPLKLAVL